MEDKSKQKRIEEYLLDPEKAIFETMEEFRAAIEQMLPVLSAINIDSLQTLKGEDGKTPQRGVDYMTQEDINALEAFILSKMPVADQDYATIQATEAFIRSEIAKIPRIKGDQGEQGKPGKPGKDGSPDSGEDIVKKVRELGPNKGWTMADIRGLDKRISIYNEAVDKIAKLREDFDNQRFVIPASNGSGGSSGATAWGTITGTLSDQTDLQTALNAKQATLVSATNIKTINGNSLLGAGDLVIAPGTTEWGDITGTLADQTDLQNALDLKAPLTAPTFATSITGSYLTASEMLITNGSKNIVSAPVATYPSLTELTYLKGVTSAIQTQIAAKQATITFGTGVQTALGVNIGSAGAPVLFNGALGTPSSGSAANLTSFPTLNQNTTGSAASLTTTRTIWGQNFNGTANVTGTLALGASDLTLTGSIGATGARATKVWTAALESTAMPTVGGTAILTSLTAPQFTTIELGHASDTTLSRAGAGDLAVEGVSVLTTSNTKTVTNKRVQPRSSTAASGDITPDLATANIWQRTAISAGITINAPTGTPVLGEVIVIMLLDNGTSRAITWNAAYTTRVMSAALPTATTISKQMLVTCQYNGTTWLCLSSSEV